MVRRTLLCAPLSLSLACVNFWSAGAAAGAPQAGAASYEGTVSSTSGSRVAAGLVQEALDAELAGDASRRRELLEKALAADPDCAAARWQSGQIRFEGAWRTIDEVGALVAKDARWQEYRRRRDAINDRIEDRVELAQWCHRNGLANEERWQWANVLLLAPDHEMARESLGLRDYDGGLYTDEQIAARERQLKQSKDDFNRLKSKFVRLCRDAIKRGPGREAALRKIRETTDPAAIGALEYGVEDAASRASDDACRDMRLAAVSALGNMPQHDATVRLLNCAVLSPMEDVRVAAANELTTRPATDYVPLLMAALRTPLEADVDVFTAPDGTVRLTETIYQEGPESDRSDTRTTNYERQASFSGFESPGETAAAMANNLRLAAERAAATQDVVAVANAEAAVRNKRIASVLQVTSGVAADFEPATWWQAWQEYNELDYPYEKPVAATYDDETYVYTPPSMTECFAAGTEVWTQSGPTPIESVSVGEMVLSQNPQTGEIGYRAVTEVSVRKARRVVDIELPGETISSTPGHRFWINGRGWQMAKFLDRSSQLHSLQGNVAVASTRPGKPAECHNLVVDEFHTFFVGKSRLLVQDKTCPRPTISGIPGSAKVREPITVGQQFGRPGDAKSPFDE